MGDLENTCAEIARVADGVWMLHGPPEQVERIRALLEEGDRQTPWGEMILLDWPFWPDEDLPATTDRHPRALATKFWYALRNRFNRLPGGRTWRCWREGYACEWVYPYGWVPEAGCPRHD